jgi:hypothetical protein
VNLQLSKINGRCTLIESSPSADACQIVAPIADLRCGSREIGFDVAFSDGSAISAVALDPKPDDRTLLDFDMQSYGKILAITSHPHSKSPIQHREKRVTIFVAKLILCADERLPFTSKKSGSRVSCKFCPKIVSGLLK